MKARGIGILGIGVYLPPEVRRNDYWSAETIRGFSAKSKLDLGAPSQELIDRLRQSESGRIAVEELAKWKDDPFHGASERRAAAPEVQSSDMEVLAAEAALDDAGVDPSEIGLLLLNSFLPDQAVPGNAGAVHKRLGLPQSTPAIEVDGVCGSFLLQVQLAAPYLATGAAKRALLVQSSLQSRCCDYTDPLSTTLGDAASAVVLGPVSRTRGFLACASATDGNYAGVAVLVTKDGTPWYAGGGPLIPGSTNPERTREVILRAGEMAKESVACALAEGGVSPPAVDLFVSHQTIAAFNGICRRGCGLEHVKTLDTFARFGSVSACAIPLNMYYARNEGLLVDDALVVGFTTGAGFNWSAAVLRWGR